MRPRVKVSSQKLRWGNRQDICSPVVIASPNTFDEAETLPESTLSTEFAYYYFLVWLRMTPSLGRKKETLRWLPLGLGVWKKEPPFCEIGPIWKRLPLPRVPIRRRHICPASHPTFYGVFPILPRFPMTRRTPDESPV